MFQAKLTYILKTDEKSSSILQTMNLFRLITRYKNMEILSYVRIEAKKDSNNSLLKRLSANNRIEKTI